jgi:HD-GYP domain-containing protein (c-di-GMP phosphodiesterase class II)
VARPESKNEKSDLASRRVVLALPESSWADELIQAFMRSGFVPHRTPSAETAALAVGYRSPLAVLVDADLLETAGVQLLDAFRREGGGTPVVVVAPESASQLRLKALLWGADDCLVRPCAPQEAVLRVRRLLENRKMLARLESAKRAAEEQCEGNRTDLRTLREDLRRNAILLQRAVEFHRRLSPTGDRVALEVQLLRQLSLETGVDRLAYLTPRHSDASWLVAQASWGLPRRLAEQLRLPATGELAALLKTGGVPLVADRVRTYPSLRLELGILAVGGFKACLPVLVKSELLAVVLLGESKSGGTPAEETLRLAHFLVSAMGPTLAAQERWARERHITAGTLGFLVATLESRSPFLTGHSARVASWAEAFGLELGMSQDELSTLTAAAVLHDIGRFQIDPALWSKMGPLEDADWDHIRRHPVEGARILAEASWPVQILSAVRHHHERWDGNGYPFGLSGSAIPWDARILSVADAMDALTSDRPNRSAISPDQALGRLRPESGIQFDPSVIEAAGRVVEAGASAA